MGITAEQFQELFTRLYSPYLIKDYVIPVRKYEDLPFDEDKPYLQTLMHQVDLKRREDPFAGAKLAGQEIYANVLNILKDGKGVHVETLLAVLGSAGGRECVDGLIGAMKALMSDGSNKQLLNSLAGVLGILVAETANGERYIMGDRIANTFCSFYDTAACTQGLGVRSLRPLSQKCATTCGRSEYWETPFDDLVQTSPKKLAELFAGKFEFSFKTYCRFPHERMIAFALAAQKAVEQSAGVIPKDKAMSIIAEYGWRTSHYMWE